MNGAERPFSPIHGASGDRCGRPSLGIHAQAIGTNTLTNTSGPNILMTCGRWWRNCGPMGWKPACIMSFVDLVGYVSDLYVQEQAGTLFAPEEADAFGTEAQTKATALAALVAQAAAKANVALDMEAEG